MVARENKSKKNYGKVCGDRDTSGFDNGIPRSLNNDSRTDELRHA